MSHGLGSPDSFYVQAEDSGNLGIGATDAYDGTCTQGEQHIYPSESKLANLRTGRHRQISILRAYEDDPIELGKLEDRGHTQSPKNIKASGTSKTSMRVL